MSQVATARAKSKQSDPTARFEMLLEQAGRQADKATTKEAMEAALETYWKARNVAKANRLGRCGEADMGLGMLLVDLDRVNEGLEAIRRAQRFFTEGGRIFHRACAHVALAEVAMLRSEHFNARRHCELAEDLFRGTGQDLMAARAVRLHAEVKRREGRDDEAAALSRRADSLIPAGQRDDHHVAA